MQYIKIKINEKIKLPATDYYSEAMKHPAPREPELWKIVDGSAIIMYPDRTYSWVSAINVNSFEPDSPEITELTSQPNSCIIDSNTLLKALAIAQDPKLAQSLIKE